MIQTMTKFALLTLSALLLFIILPAEQADAQQWGIGGSFETRDEDPNNGFGVRIERQILSTLPVIDVRLRGHFSYFSERVDSYRDFSARTDLESYDFGLAALAGLGLAFLKPYAGIGLGSENFEAVQEGAAGGSFEDSSLYWNVFGGSQFTMLPVVKPFVEYRFTRLFEQDEWMHNQHARWAFGVLIEF